MKNKLFNSLKYFIFPTLVIILFIVGSIIKEPVNLLTKDSPNILVKVDTLNSTSMEISAHNQILVSVLQSRESSNVMSSIASDDGLKQTRSIYFSALAILIVLLLTKKENRIQLSLVLLLFILVMYSFDVHLDDLRLREKAYTKMNSRGLDSLITANSINTTWYELNTLYALDLYAKMGESPNRYFRKIWVACQLDFSRSVFYVVPGLCVYIYLVIQIKKRQKIIV